MRERPEAATTTVSRASIDLYWLPLGAGGHSVRLNGRFYEAVAARLGRRRGLIPLHFVGEIVSYRERPGLGEHRLGQGAIRNR